MIIKAVKRIFNSDKMCRSYSDLNFGVTFFGTQCISVFFCLCLPDWRINVCIYTLSQKNCTTILHSFITLTMTQLMSGVNVSVHVCVGKKDLLSI